MYFREPQNRFRSMSNNNNNMHCPNQILHTIQSGDTLYSLARRYFTTVEDILALNPGTEIYNLRIGSTLVICPGQPPVTPVPPIGTLPPTPVPPIEPEPPVMPMPPIGPSIPEAVRELILFIIHWVRRHFNEQEARSIMECFSDDVWKI